MSAATPKTSRARWRVEDYGPEAQAFIAHLATLGPKHAIVKWAVGRVEKRRFELGCDLPSAIAAVLAEAKADPGTSGRVLESNVRRFQRWLSAAGAVPERPSINEAWRPSIIVQEDWPPTPPDPQITAQFAGIFSAIEALSTEFAGHRAAIERVAEILNSDDAREQKPARPGRLKADNEHGAPQQFLKIQWTRVVNAIGPKAVAELLEVAPASVARSLKLGHVPTTVDIEQLDLLYVAVRALELDLDVSEPLEDVRRVLRTRQREAAADRAFADKDA